MRAGGVAAAVAALALFVPVGPVGSAIAAEPAPLERRLNYTRVTDCDRVGKDWVLGGPAHLCLTTKIAPAAGRGHWTKWIKVWCKHPRAHGRCHGLERKYPAYIHHIGIAGVKGRSERWVMHRDGHWLTGRSNLIKFVGPGLRVKRPGLLVAVDYKACINGGPDDWGSLYVRARNR